MHYTLAIWPKVLISGGGSSRQGTPFPFSCIWSADNATMQQEKSMPFGDHNGSPELNNTIMPSVVAVVTSSIIEVADASAARCMA